LVNYEGTNTLVGMGRRVIMYDARGTGSSDRGSADFSLEGRLRDLEAVIERTGVDRFALSGVLQGGPTAVAYAVRHPDRVSRLVLYATYARGADWYEIPALRWQRAARAMAEEYWEYFTQQMAHASTGFRDSDLANRVAAVFRSGTSARTYLSYGDATETIDVTDLLPRVNAPTLVMHQASSPLSNVDLLRVLASRIPNARLVSTEDTSGTIDAFLREDEKQCYCAGPALRHDRHPLRRHRRLHRAHRAPRRHRLPGEGAGARRRAANADPRVRGAAGGRTHAGRRRPGCVHVSARGYRSSAALRRSG
jgi:alpha/beta hydrolase fold